MEKTKEKAKTTARWLIRRCALPRCLNFMASLEWSCLGLGKVEEELRGR